LTTLAGFGAGVAAFRVAAGFAFATTAIFFGAAAFVFTPARTGTGFAFATTATLFGAAALFVTPARTGTGFAAALPFEATDFKDFAGATCFRAGAGFDRPETAFVATATFLAATGFADFAAFAGFAGGTAFFATTCFFTAGRFTAALATAAFFAGSSFLADAAFAGAALMARAGFAGAGLLPVAFVSGLAAVFDFAVDFAAAAEARPPEVTLIVGFTDFLVAGLALLALAGEFLIEPLSDGGPEGFSGGAVPAGTVPKSNRIGRLYHLKRLPVNMAGRKSRALSDVRFPVGGGAGGWVFRWQPVRPDAVEAIANRGV